MTGCGLEPPPPPDGHTGGGEGAPCGGALLCEEGRLCVDGRCQIWPWYRNEDAVVAEGWTFPDTGSNLGPESDVVDASNDVAPDIENDVQDGELTDGQSAQDVAAELPGDGASGDGDGSIDSDGGTDISDGGNDTAPGPIVLLIGDDDAENAAGDTSVALKSGEAWVRGLYVPLDASLIGVQVLLGSFLGAKSCGRFRPALWLSGADGEFGAEPDYVEPGFQYLNGNPDQPQEVWVSTPIELQAGLIRVGLVYDGPCKEGDSIPLLLTDVSGDVSQTWYWAPQPDASPWVPGQFLGVKGKWAIRAVVEVYP
jgi:hypothetical protein